MASRDRFVPLHSPTLWPTWVGVWLFRQLCKLPWPAQVRLGRFFGRLIFHVVRLRRKIVSVNLELCFPEKSREERRALALAHYESMGIGIFETGMAWWGPDEKLPSFTIVGRENLETASTGGRGVLLLTAHFTTLEICGRFFVDNIPMGGLYREPDNRVIAHEMFKHRVAKMKPAIPMDDLRGLLRGLRDGATIWYAPDQGKKSKFAAILPFFGVPALTNTATSKIAQMSGAAVVPYFGFRMEDGSYRLEILPALENFPTDDANEDAIRINRLIEDQIQRAPEQYFWMHRRFKKRGKGLPNVYR